ncbi:MAG TPA: class I SAM-dependent methyltransferase [Azospirillaceae bacterium]|nr:class I SAM-dependent methyltransferase [Azospirillaceae bacterium]
MSAGRCRFCETKLEHTFCDLGVQPLSNAYVSDLRQGENFYPLHAFVCGECLLVQIEAVVPADHIFDENYAYFSSFSDTWLRAAEAYVAMMTWRFGYGPKSQVMEIASNDGYLLQYFVKRGVPVLGIEPAANCAAAAQEKGVETLVRFFGTETAKNLVAQGRRADLLLGNNVLAHVPDINDFVAGMKIALAPGGVITMEFPHLQRLMEQGQFDTIYHEHFSYLSFGTVERIFARHGLTLFDVEELPTHGGSLRIFGRHAEDTVHAVTPRVAAMKAQESAAGLDRLSGYADFEERVRAIKRDLLDFLIAAKRQGKKVAGYGAPAKGNTLLNYAGVRTDLVDFTVDRSPHKQGRYLPGTRIPILAPDAIMAAKPDYLLILPWNLRDEIMGQMAGIRDWGGKFVVPIPGLQVLG